MTPNPIWLKARNIIENKLVSLVLSSMQSMCVCLFVCKDIYFMYAYIYIYICMEQKAKSFWKLLNLIKLVLVILPET